MAAHIKYPVVSGAKECGDCHQFKPISEYGRARNHYESRCRDCKKRYAAEYRQRPESKLHSQEYHREYMKNSEHRSRSNELQRKYNKLPARRLKKNSRRRDWSSREKQKAVDYKGGKCCLCGYSTCLAALDFHHIDPSKKEGYGKGGALKAHWTFERNKSEIDKCILVCVRCHREIHAGLHQEYLKS